jgi:peptidoglycan DL-endopeptidase CwlO
MVDGIINVVRVPSAVPVWARQSITWDSRESPGSNSEADLSGPSTRRALTAGAIALAVIAPTVELAERPAEAGSSPPSSTPAVPPAPGFDPIVTLAKRAPRASRFAGRGPSAGARAGVRPAAAAVRQVARRAADRERIKIAAVRRAARDVERRPDVERRSVAPRRAIERRRRPHPVVAPRRIGGGRMAVVIAFARAQLGKRYESGGEGPNSFDCSGFTKRAYAQIGLRLPHSSGGQAARVRRVSRSAARPGDLVYGPGHVGVYMGGGMMIDAGNRRTGVVYRRLYAGLQVGRW